LQRLFALWGISQVHVPRLAKLKSCSATADLPQLVNNTVGWIDSTEQILDLKEKGKHQERIQVGVIRQMVQQ